jgi:serine/threonine-protein kinase
MTAELPDPERLAVGTKLAGRYMIQERIGVGGMAQVYRGEHSTIARPVAIKVLSSDFVRTPAVVVRFLQEARAASQVAHENVVEVTDFGETDDGRPFIVMELLEGESLAETMLAEGPLSWPRTQALLLQILAALGAAHERRVIHRDMKPGNCFRIQRHGSADFIKVLDFGIAKVLREDGTGISLTAQGTVMGTPDYMSPEQCRGTKVDPRADLYALGVMTYEMLTGRLPFASKRPIDVMHMHVFEVPPPMSEVAPEADITPAMAKLVRKAMAKSPSDRFADAAAFAAAVRAIAPKETAADSGLLTGLRRLFGRK